MWIVTSLLGVGPASNKIFLYSVFISALRPVCFQEEKATLLILLGIIAEILLALAW